MDYTGECSSCHSEFNVKDTAVIPLFNSVRKSDWNQFQCASCGTKNKFARFAKNSDLLIVVS